MNKPNEQIDTPINGTQAITQSDSEKTTQAAVKEDKSNDAVETSSKPIPEKKPVITPPAPAKGDDEVMSQQVKQS